MIDLLAYLSHALFHGAPWLWRLHRAHHSDVVMDASTRVRHHPVEALASAALQLMIFVVLGVPLLVILAYGLITTLWQFVNHADVRLPEPIDRALSLVLVTSGMHRVHHSVRMDRGQQQSWHGPVHWGPPVWHQSPPCGGGAGGHEAGDRRR